MTALTLPFPTVTAAEVAVRSGWAVVDGALDWCSCDDPDCAPAIKNERVAPPEWVRAAEPCTECGGKGWVQEGVFSYTHGVMAECPSCHGVGKPRVEVTAACPICLGFWALHDCRRCTAGIFHVGWVTITEVLPVVGDPDDFADPIALVEAWGANMHWPNGCVNYYAEGATDEGEQVDITADVAHLGPPVELVGKWLLKFELQRCNPPSVAPEVDLQGLSATSMTLKPPDGLPEGDCDSVHKDES